MKQSVLKARMAEDKTRVLEVLVRWFMKIWIAYSLFILNSNISLQYDT